MMRLCQLADMYQPLRTIPKDTIKSSLVKVMQRFLEPLSRFDNSTDAMVNLKHLSNLTVLAVKLGCRHEDKKDEEECDFGLLHLLMDVKMDEM